MIGNVTLGLGNVPIAGQSDGNGGGGGGGSAVDGLRRGSNLPDSNITINPGSDQISMSVILADTLAGNRTLTVDTAGNPPIGTIYEVVRRDLGAFTYTVVNGGPGAGTLYTFAASPLTPQRIRISWDGTNWNFYQFAYVTGGDYEAPTSPLFLGAQLAEWWRGDLGVTNAAGNASAWRGQKNGTNAAQATAGARPAIVVSSGFDALRFTSTKGLTFAPGLWASGAERTVIAVHKSATVAGGIIMGTRSTGRSWTAVLENNGVADVVYSDLVAALGTLTTVPVINNGALRVSQWHSVVGAPVNYSLDGTSLTAVTNVTSDTGGTSAGQLGNYYGLDDGFPGDIFEIIAINGALSATDQFKINAYLANRYGFSI